MLLIAKGSFRELVGGSDDILADFRELLCGALHEWQNPREASPGAAIDASRRKRIGFTPLATNVTLGPVTVHPSDLAVLAR